MSQFPSFVTERKNDRRFDVSAHKCVNDVKTSGALHISTVETAGSTACCNVAYVHVPHDYYSKYQLLPCTAFTSGSCERTRTILSVRYDTVFIFNPYPANVENMVSS